MAGPNSNCYRAATPRSIMSAGRRPPKRRFVSCCLWSCCSVDLLFCGVAVLRVAISSVAVLWVALLSVAVLGVAVSNLHLDKHPTVKIVIRGCSRTTRQTCVQPVAPCDYTYTHRDVSTSRSKSKTPPSIVSTDESGIDLSSKKRVTMINLQKIRVLAYGGFGKVFHVRDGLTGMEFAMKEIHGDSETRPAILKEVKTMRNLRHPRIVKYIGYRRVCDKFQILMELAPGGSLEDLIAERGGRLTETEAQRFTVEILEGVEYLHCRQTAHRDIKGANVLLSESGHVKLCDFGLASNIDTRRSDDHDTTMASFYWTAPEMVDPSGGPQDWFMADIWSVGCVVVEMLTGYPPWWDTCQSNKFAVVTKLMSGNCYPDYTLPHKVSHDARHFLDLCFTRNPSDRPSAFDLLHHQWLERCRSAFSESDSG